MRWSSLLSHQFSFQNQSPSILLRWNILIDNPQRDFLICSGFAPRLDRLCVIRATKENMFQKNSFSFPTHMVCQMEGWLSTKEAIWGSEVCYLQLLLSSEEWQKRLFMWSPEAFIFIVSFFSIVLFMRFSPGKCSQSTWEEGLSHRRYRLNVSIEN